MLIKIMMMMAIQDNFKKIIIIIFVFVINKSIYIINPVMYTY